MYVPTAETLRRLAVATGNEHLLHSTDAEWDCRQWLTPPGLVWSVASDTCMTGRSVAANNIAYGEFGQEFVFRQPRNEQELVDLLGAASNETFDCYRFDGLTRWTSESAAAWNEMTNVVEGWLHHTLGGEADDEIAGGLSAFLAYLHSDEFSRYRTSLFEYLKVSRPS